MLRILQEEKHNSVLEGVKSNCSLEMLISTCWTHNTKARIFGEDPNTWKINDNANKKLMRKKMTTSDINKGIPDLKVAEKLSSQNYLCQRIESETTRAHCLV